MCNIVSTLQTLKTLIFTVKIGVFKKIQCLMICMLPLNFFCHECLDAVEMLVCLIKSVILDSDVCIFELYMDQLALLNSFFTWFFQHGQE